MIKIALHATNVEARVLAMCEPGLEVTTWTLPGIEFIYFFIAGTYSGQGRIIKLHKSKVPGLTALLDNASVEIRAIEGTTCILAIELDVSEQAFAAAQEEGWPPSSLPF